MCNHPRVCVCVGLREGCAHVCVCVLRVYVCVLEDCTCVSLGDASELMHTCGGAHVCLLQGCVHCSRLEVCKVLVDVLVHMSVSVQVHVWRGMGGGAILSPPSLRSSGEWAAMLENVAIDLDIPGLPS